MPEDPKVVVAEDPPKPVEEPVDVTPPPKPEDTDAIAAKVKADFEALYGSRIKQVEDRLHGAYRINEKLQQQVEALTKRPPTPAAATAAPTDPWATVENGPAWKAEIERLADAKAEAKLRAWQSEQAAVAQQQVQVSTLEQSKRDVISRYPDLDPTTGNMDSPVSKAYVSVINEHPDWLTNVYGPQLAMYAMEEKLKAAAPAGSPAKARPSLTLPPSRPAAPGGERLTITKEEKAFCDHHKLDYATYLKNKVAAEQGVVEA